MEPSGLMNGLAERFTAVEKNEMVVFEIEKNASVHENEPRY